jgi:hypothetical protein
MPGTSESAGHDRRHNLSRRARVYCALVTTLGLAATASAVLKLASQNTAQLIVWSAIAVMLAGLKLRIPRVTATVSCGSMMIFAALSCMSWPGIVMIAALTGLGQSLLNTLRAPQTRQVLFSVAALVISAVVSCSAIELIRRCFVPAGTTVLIATGVTIFLISNITLLSGILTLAEGQPIFRVMRRLYVWSIPQYGASAIFGALVSSFSARADWRPLLVFLPFVVVIYTLGYVLLRRPYSTEIPSGVSALTHRALTTGNLVQAVRSERN